MKSANDKVRANLKRMIHEKHTSGEKLAFESEVGKSILSRILRGKQNPSVEILEKLANALEIDIKDFFA